MSIRLLLLGLASLLSFNSFAACTTYWDTEALGDTQVDSISLYSLRGVPVAHLTTAHLKQIVDIKNKLAFAANVKAKLWLCDDPTLNAYAIANANLIVFHLAYLNFLEWNRDAIAGVMAHEVAHIALRHSGAAQSRKTQETLDSLSAAASGDKAKLAGLTGIAPVQLTENDRKVLFQLLFLKFKREDEQQADDEGLKLMTRVGINPEGVTRVQLAVMNRLGNVGGGYFGTHPSLKERIQKSQFYLATSSAAKELVAQLQYQAVTDEEFSDAAEGFIKSQSWKKLGVLTKQWLARSDESALAFYYRGIYQSAGLKQTTAARRMFYRAVELDPGNPKARLELCVALFEEGRKLESTYCYRNMATDEYRDEFKARTFGDYLWVAGEVEPFTAIVATRDENGRKYITNLEFARQRSLVISKYVAD